MNDNDLFSHDDIERMLTPRCSFRASDNLKGRIVSNVSAAPRKKFGPAAWAAAAASVAAVITCAIFLPGTEERRTPDSEITVASAIRPQAPATPRVAATPAETSTATEVAPPRPAAKRRQPVAEPGIPVGVPPCAQPVTDDNDGHSELFRFDLADEDLFNTDDFSYGYEEVYAMIDVTEQNTFPMKTTPEERIRMQREESLEYLDRARLELQECRDLYLNLHTLQ